MIGHGGQLPEVEHRGQPLDAEHRGHPLDVEHRGQLLLMHIIEIRTVCRLGVVLLASPTAKY